MYCDEIIAEVWRNRDNYTARHHHNLDEMVADLRERQKQFGCKLVDRRNQIHGIASSFARKQRKLEDYELGEIVKARQAEKPLAVEVSLDDL